VICDRDVPGDTHRTSNSAMPPDAYAACNAGACRYRGVGADVDVMGDLNLVVEFHTVFYDGVVDRAAIDRCVRANLDIICDAHTADLGYFHPTIAIKRNAEAVGTDHHARVSDDAITQ
jgi:hypothetical protein